MHKAVRCIYIIRVKKYCPVIVRYQVQYLKDIDYYRCLGINGIACKTSWQLPRDLWEGPKRMKLGQVTGPKLGPLI